MKLLGSIFVFLGFLLLLFLHLLAHLLFGGAELTVGILLWLLWLEGTL